MNEILTEVIKALIVALFPVLLTVLGKGFMLFWNWIEAKTTNETLKRIEHEALEVVMAVAQSVKPALIEASKDGRLDETEKQRLKDAAMTALRHRLLDLPAAMLPGLDKRLSESVERAVKKLAISETPTGNPLPPLESK